MGHTINGLVFIFSVFVFLAVLFAFTAGIIYGVPAVTPLPPIGGVILFLIIVSIPIANGVGGILAAAEKLDNKYK